MAITLKDIAEQAKVSQATVSIAMGSSGRISSDTRERILRIAEELGYRPNMLVHGIQTGRTMAVGVLMDFAGEVFDAQLFTGIHDTLARADYVPIVLKPSPDISVLQQIHALIDRRVDGIILRPAAEALWEKHLSEALDRHVPVVAVDIEPQAETPHIDFVGTDDIGGAHLAATKLLEAGHRELAVVTTGSLPDTMHFRSEGFMAAVADTDGARCVCEHEPWKKGIDGYDAARRALSRTPRPTAVFVTMDRLADGVYHAAHDLGLSIPGDLSVVGFADEPIARLLNPQLSTMHQRPDEIGRRATELLLQRINEGDVHGERQRILIAPDWAMRDSVAAPGKA